MTRITNMLLLSILALGVSACATPPVEVEKVAACAFPESGDQAPQWVCDGRFEGVTVGAVAAAERSDAGIAFMKQIAANKGRVQLARNMKVQVENMIRQYADAAGAGSEETVDRVTRSVTGQFTDQTLDGSRVFVNIVAPDGEMYVLVGLDEAATQKLAEAAVRTSLSNDPSAWAKFKSQKNPDELAAEIARQKVGIAVTGVSAMQ
jgi:ABC-type branched-subunit amino acid transport system substrate-binding protein